VKRISAFLVCAWLGWANAALADAAAEARTYFEVGAKAYKVGDYTNAIQAFEEAYRRANRPGLLFSIAQANRMEYFARNDPARLRDAVRYYQTYLAAEPKGKRAGEVTEILARLKPLLPSDAPPMTPVAPAAMPVSTKPRVMISSPTPKVRVTFDGRNVSHPYIQEVAPGKHSFTLRAPGFADYKRDIVVDAKGGSPAYDVALKELPAKLEIVAPDGCEVALDGRLQGVTPLPALSVASGTHFVAVTKNGKKAWSTQVALKRGQTRRMEVTLESTGQRTASYILIGIGSAGVVAGGVLGYLSLQKQSDAEEIRDQSEGSGGLPESQLARYDSLRQSRDDLRLAAFVTAGAGLGVGTLGLFLNLFDEPKAPLPPAEKAPGAPESKPSGMPAMEISALPLDGGGAALLHGRF
jgi:tetratricopeptide (TPR) repeat protein